MADETPEERLARFKKKADALGPQPWSAPPEGSQEPSPPDIDLDEPEPLTWSNAGERMTQYPATLLPKVPEEKQSAIMAALTTFRNKVAMAAEPAAFKMEQVVPGATQVREMLDKLSAPREDPPEQKLRSPYMQTREFSNEADKEAYLERVRQAMKNASKK